MSQPLNQFNKTIPYSKQHIDDCDIQAITHTLGQERITGGIKVAEFEKKVSEFCQARFALSFPNASIALMMAIHALELEPKTQAITSPITFAATAHCALHNGLELELADTEKNIPLLDPQSLLAKIQTETRLVLPVHYAGFSCNMKRIHEIARDHGLRVIEDGAHAFGSSYWNENEKTWHPVGSCKFSDLCVFSFHPVKNLTTAEGGMITTNDENLFQKLKILRDSGIQRDNPNQPGWYYDVVCWGLNGRLTEMQAALGISQLRKFKKLDEQKKLIFSRYQKAFENLDKIELIDCPSLAKTSLHLAVVRVKKPYQRDDLYQFLRQKGVNTQVHYIPLYQHSYFQKQNPSLRKENFPNSQNFFEEALSIPFYADLGLKDQEYVIEQIKKWQAQKSKSFEFVENVTSS